MITVILVDDDQIVLRTFAAYLKNVEGLSLVQVFVRVSDAQEWLRCNSVDVVVSDISIPEMDGFQFGKWVAVHRPDAAMLFITAYDKDRYLLKSIQMGAGFVLKDVHPDGLVHAIKCAHHRLTTFTSSSVRRAVKVNEDHLNRLVAEFNLSEPQRQLLSLVAHGATNIDISEKLVLSLSRTKALLSDL